MTGPEVTSMHGLNELKAAGPIMKKIKKMYQTVEITRCLRSEFILAPNPNRTETGLKVRKLSRT